MPTDYTDYTDFFKEFRRPGLDPGSISLPKVLKEQGGFRVKPGTTDPVNLLLICVICVICGQSFCSFLLTHARPQNLACPKRSCS